MRGELDNELNALDNLSEGREFIEINGQQKHVLGYLQDFLFTPERARSPVRVFSGGERARLMLAKLFSKPANILVLDEPTNDLDVETLELLESQLVSFAGTVVVISHDREFLDNVVTDTLFLDGSGQVSAAVGGYSDWRRQGGRFPTEAEVKSSSRKNAPPVKESPKSATPSPKTSAKKMSFKLKHELEQLPGEIAALEESIAADQAQVSDSAFYSRPHDEVTAVLEGMAEKEKALESKVERWMELEEMAG